MARIKVGMTRKNATSKLKKVQCLMQDDEMMQKRRDFIDKFVQCEVACKHIVESYKRHKRALKPGEYVTLDMRHIPVAMATYGYEIQRHILSDIFSSSKTRGKKSAKKLRDGIMHSMNEEDLKEIIIREGFMHNIMDAFLSCFE